MEVYGHVCRVLFSFIFFRFRQSLKLNEQLIYFGPPKRDSLKRLFEYFLHTNRIEKREKKRQH